MTHNIQDYIFVNGQHVSINVVGTSMFINGCAPPTVSLVFTGHVLSDTVEPNGTRVVRSAHKGTVQSLDATRRPIGKLEGPGVAEIRRTAAGEISFRVWLGEDTSAAPWQELPPTNVNTATTVVDEHKQG